MGIVNQGTRLSQRKRDGSAANESRDYSRGCFQDVGGPSYTASTISFSGNVISDSANGLGVFTLGQYIQVTGAGQANNVSGVIISASAGALTLDGTNNFTTQVAGSPYTISQN
jgi:hypothetical protein